MDYTGCRQTLLSVREINLKACASLVILNQIIRPDRDRTPAYTGNSLK